MKHSILPVLFWTLATCSAFAQKTLTPGVQPYAENWPAALKNILQDAGFGIAPASAAMPLQSRNSDLQLDSTKTFFGYNLNGTPDSTPLSRSVYQRPQNNTEIEIDAQFQNGAWVPVSRLSKVADTQGRLLELVAEEYDVTEATFQPGSKLQFFPRGNSVELIDSIKAFLWDTDQNAWAFVFHVHNTFGPNDRLTVSQITLQSDGETVVLSDVYSYNANQDNHLIESFMQSGGFSIPTAKQELMYLNHQLIQVIDFEADDFGDFIPNTRITYAYNPSQSVTQENTYQWVPGVNDWNPTQSISYEYDNAERLTAQETAFIHGGIPDVKERVAYAYVEDQYLALETSYTWDIGTGAFALADRTYYYYAGGVLSVSPSPRAVQKLVITPNPTADAVQLLLETEAEVRVFDAAGQLVQSQVMQPGETLHLTALPPGVYQVRAQHGVQFYTGKVLKF